MYAEIVAAYDNEIIIFYSKPAKQWIRSYDLEGNVTGESMYHSYK